MNGQFAEAQDRIIVALDVPSLDEAIACVRLLAPHVGLFKVGLELMMAEGAPRVITAIRGAGGRVMCDAKLNDIPNTVAAATREIDKCGAEMFTMHISSGSNSIEAAIANRGRSKVIGVTVLTSIDAEECENVFGDEPTHKVLYFMRKFFLVGGDALVCSPQEVSTIRKDETVRYVNLTRRQHEMDPVLLITPGVRPAWAAANDQKRVMTPGDAIRAGADYLVIGRPILKPPSIIDGPVNAAQAIAKEIQEALSESVRP